MNVDKYEQEYEELLNKWAEGKPDFFRDGAISSNEWFKQEEVRPLFLLKEAYKGEKDPEEYDLRKWMDGEKYKDSIKKVQFIVFKKILQWASIILGETDGKNTIDKMQEQYVWNNPLFKRIAYVNVKKYEGKSRSNQSDLDNCVKRDGKKLYDQITLLDPTMIVCGGTIRWLKTILNLDPSIKSKKNKNHPYYVYKTTLNNHSLYIIDFWHPAYFGKPERSFCEEIANAKHEIARKQKNGL